MLNAELSIMLIGDWIGNKTQFILGVAFFSAILILNPLAAFATGDDTPANGECDNPTVKNEPVVGGSDTQNAGAGNTITGLCIKDGNGAFALDPVCLNGNKHSCLLTAPGNYAVGINNCYQVMGIGTQQATVSENPGASTGTPNCGGLSHVEYFTDFNGKVGGHGGITSKTSLLVTGATLNASWMIPLLVSAVGIGIFVITYKKE